MNKCCRVRSRSLMYFLCVLLLAPGAAAQSRLTLAEVFHKVREQNLQLRQADVKLRQAENEVAIRVGDRLPRVALTGSYNYISELARLEVPLQLPGLTIPPIEAGVHNQYDAALVVSQPLFTGFRLAHQVKEARARKQQAHTQRLRAEQQLLFQAGLLYYSLHLNRIQEQVLEQSLARVSSQKQRVVSLLKAAQAVALDTLEAATRELELRTQLQNLRNNRQILRRKLTQLMQVDSLPPLAPLTGETRPLQSLAFYQEQALLHRPEMQELIWTEQAQRARKSVATSLYFPQVSAVATYHYARPGVNFFRDRWMDYYTVGVSLQWQLWNWRQTHQRIEQVDLELQALALQRQQLQQQISREVEEVYLNLQHLQQQERLREELAAKEQERYRHLSERYQQGFATALDVADAERALTTAELLLQQTRILYRQNRLQLQFVTGRIGNSDVSEE